MLTRLLILLAASLEWCACAGPAYPLKTVGGSHYLFDQNGAPFFMQGDSAWNIPQTAGNAAVKQYLADRQAKGFNTIVCEMIEKFYQPTDPTNIYNQIPFTNLISGTWWNFASVNPDYFTNIDFILSEAQSRGIQIIMAPAWIGSSDPRGFYVDMSHNTMAALTNYGKFLGSRYRNYPNIIWLMGGDRNVADKTTTEAIVDGILSIDSNHLFTAHPYGGVNSLDFWNESWDKINAVYTNFWSGSTFSPQGKSLDAYNHSPAAPAFLVEGTYEGDPNSSFTVTDLSCRQIAYGAVLSGSIGGHMFGNYTVYQFASGWQTALNSAGATTMSYLANLVRNRQWYNWVPDTNHTIVTSGYGTIGQFGYVAVSTDVASNSIVAYLPQGSNQLPVVAMTKLLSPLAKANASWFNPRTGVTTGIGPFATTGTQTFQAPDTNDWVLFLDAQVVSTQLRNGANLNLNTRISLR